MERERERESESESVLRKSMLREVPRDYDFMLRVERLFGALYRIRSVQ